MSHDDDDLELSPLAMLVAEGIERIERGESGVVDRLCEDNPDLAAALRARFGRLNTHQLLAAPTAFGPYRCLRILGRGGMGVVHLARDERMGRLVALKVLPPGGREGMAERFRREIVAVARLRHPGIVPVFDVGEEDGSPYFAMEYVDGVTLQERLDDLRERGLGPEHLIGDGTPDAVRSTCLLVAQLADALQHAHEQGVIHRDVKPGNVLLDAGRPRLFDFGLARVVDERSMTQVGDIAGTPSYVAPEVLARGGAACTVASDIWSLGITLFELLTFQRPPSSVTSTALQPGAVSALRAAVPPTVDELIRRTLVSDPDRRPASAAAFANALRHAVGVDVDEAPTMSATRAVAGTLIAVAALAALFWLMRDPPVDTLGDRWRAVERLADDGKPRRALEVSAETWATVQPATSEEQIIDGLIVTARALNRSGQYERARELAASALRAARTRYGDDSPWVARAAVEYGVSFIADTHDAPPPKSLAEQLHAGQLQELIDTLRDKR